MASSEPSLSIALDATTLAAYRLRDDPLEIVRGSTKREWMDALPQRFGYRCLPLLIANQAGWDLLLPRGFSARWNGKTQVDSVKFRWDGEPLEAVSSHFGSGVITISTGYLFRTPQGHNLWVKGCPNHLKHGAVPLEGIVETDWGPFTFTMNWRITRPRRWVRFEAGEPICRIVPFPRHYLEQFEPRHQELDTNEALREEYQQWRDSRYAFIRDLREGVEDVVEQGWQRDYVRGQKPEGDTWKDHQTKLKLKDFEKG